MGIELPNPHRTKIAILLPIGKYAREKLAPSVRRSVLPKLVRVNLGVANGSLKERVPP